MNQKEINEIFEEKWTPKVRDFVWYYEGAKISEAVIIGLTELKNVYMIEIINFTLDGNPGLVEAHIRQLEKREPELPKTEETFFIPRFAEKPGLSFPKKSLVDAVKVTSRQFPLLDVLEVRVVKVHPVNPQPFCDISGARIKNEN